MYRIDPEWREPQVIHVTSLPSNRAAAADSEAACQPKIKFDRCRTNTMPGCTSRYPQVAGESGRHHFHGRPGPTGHAFESGRFLYPNPVGSYLLGSRDVARLRTADGASGNAGGSGVIDAGVGIARPLVP